MPHLTNRFFILFGSITALFALAYPVPVLLPLAKALFFVALAVVGVDWALLFFRRPALTGWREVASVWSLSDPNPVKLHFQNQSNLRLFLSIYDELPFQIQRRDFEAFRVLGARKQTDYEYDVKPLTRGEYEFGHISVLASTVVGLLERRFQLGEAQTVNVYPSIIQMKQFELKAIRQTSQADGIKKIRRLGHSYEFEQIKNYVEGDEYRSINWKASSRRSTLMVNQYEDERSQQVYCIIDKSRIMRMPFEGLSLMDYAINTTLAISNIIIKKQDKAGLLSFSNVMGTTLKAERDTGQMRRILEALYREKERPVESNFELLYEAVRRLVGARSLLLIFTNFESNYGLERALPSLRRLGSSHLVVVVFFENTEIRTIAQQPVKTTSDIYRQTVSRQFLQEKKEMVTRLRQYGIQAILTKPEDLTVNTINKYLELKSRGLL